MQPKTRKIAIIPHHKYIEPQVVKCLKALRETDYAVWEAGEVSDVTRQRGIFASNALSKGYEWILWIDSDVIFDPECIKGMESHGKEVVGGICALRSDRRFNCIFRNDQTEVTFGEGGGLLEVEAIGTGFLLTHRTAYEKIIQAKLIPECAGDEGFPVYPFFSHLCGPIGSRKDRLYLGEDYSFCLRAKEAGVAVYADTSVRLGHLGLYPYSWEDVVSPLERYATCIAKVTQESASKP